MGNLFGLTFVFIKKSDNIFLETFHHIYALTHHNFLYTALGYSI